MLRLVLTITLLLWPALTQAQTVVRFHGEVQVAGQDLVLADIAEIEPANDELAQLPVGPAPAPGKSKKFNTATLASSLQSRTRGETISWQGSQTVTVQRLGQQVSREELENMVNQYLQENQDMCPVSAECRFSLISGPKEVVVPTGTLSWQITPSRQGSAGATSFSVALSVDDNDAGTCLLRGRVTVLAEVVVTTRPLRRGDVINAAGLSVQRQDIADVVRPVTDIDAPVGMLAARSIPAGSILVEDYVVSPPVVKKGDVVKIFARKNALRISTEGLAMRDGREGEVIAVKNISSNKMLRCRVDGPNTVSVEF
ncbi:MAG: flagellar basal body P-ring formation chaperone FlgA [Desulfobulbus sp.]|jgi:flagella basal body P-ring formation protein FlgA